jgi:hypothetical protein
MYIIVYWRNYACVCYLIMTSEENPEMQCPYTQSEGVKVWGDWCYLFAQVETVSYPEAQLACQKWGGPRSHVASVGSKDEYKFLHTELDPLNSNVWLGGVKDGMS